MSYCLYPILSFSLGNLEEMLNCFVSSIYRRSNIDKRALRTLLVANSHRYLLVASLAKLTELTSLRRKECPEDDEK